MKYLHVYTVLIVFMSLSSCDGNDFEDRIPVMASDYVDDGIDRYEHGFVDLGLPSGTLWATSNLDAKGKTDKGLLYTWGDTNGHKDGEVEYGWENYVHVKIKTISYYGVLLEEYRLSKYSYTRDHAYTTPDKKTVLDLVDDAAHVKWGGKWRIPSDEQFDELCNYCRKEKAAGNAIKLTGPNGNSITIPSGDYWTRSLLEYEWLEEDSDLYAYRYTINYKNPSISSTGYLRYYGYYIRPVMLK